MSDREMYDRLLELAGECRHEWGEFDQSGGVRHWCKCGASWHGDFYGPRAAVGDGRQMSLGEMWRLWAKVGGTTATVSLSWDYRVDRAFPAQIHTAKVERRLPPSTDTGRTSWKWEAAQRQGDTPELALAAAIIAAVDGAK